jgi:putative ABC transport system permease protein
MWFLAWREMRYGKGRFMLIGLLVALVAFLVFVMTGLAAGLSELSTSALRRMPADLLVYSDDADKNIARSDLAAADAVKAAAVDGVESADPLGQLLVTGTLPGGKNVDVALQGVASPGTFRTPPEIGSVVLDPSARDDGVKVTDTIRLKPSGVVVTVVGFADFGTLQGAAVGSVNLATWQKIHPSTADLGPERASVFVLKVSGDRAKVARAVEKALPGTDVLTKSEAIANIPGHAAESATIGMIRGFLLAATAGMIAVLFWILTLQKQGTLAVLRATGARRRTLVGSYLMQVSLITVFGTVLGIAATEAVSPVMPSNAFSLTGGDVGRTALLLAACALIASLVCVRRLLRVDPLLSLGRNA